MPLFQLHDMLRTRRSASGLTAQRLAHILGLSAMSLYDLETHEDEWRTVTPFATVMTACRLLDIDLIAYIPASDCERIVARRTAGETVKLLREARGLTLETFANRVGIETPGAAAFEIGDCLTLWPYDVIASVTDALDIDCRSFVEKTMWTSA
ncbi:MAG: helix-turn-helix domain-containing protein [Hyphomicrobiaceae bacterium]